eukprot:9489206-Pyramimonas_sp.AAC.1
MAQVRRGWVLPRLVGRSVGYNRCVGVAERFGFRCAGSGGASRAGPWCRRPRPLLGSGHGDR